MPVQQRDAEESTVRASGVQVEAAAVLGSLAAAQALSRGASNAGALSFQGIVLNVIVPVRHPEGRVRATRADFCKEPLRRLERGWQRQPWPYEFARNATAVLSYC
jgi:hypothetical protein